MTASDLTPYDPRDDAFDEEAPQVSDRSRSVSLALAITLGWAGGHRFYAGRVGSGLAMLFTLGGLGLWWLYDFIVVVAGEFKDEEGRLIRRWSTAEFAGAGPASDRRVAELQRQLYALRGEVSELAERLDFAERMLAQHQQRDRLPGKP